MPTLSFTTDTKCKHCTYYKTDGRKGWCCYNAAPTTKKTPACDNFLIL